MGIVVVNELGAVLGIALAFFSAAGSYWLYTRLNRPDGRARRVYELAPNFSMYILMFGGILGLTAGWTIFEVMIGYAELVLSMQSLQLVPVFGTLLLALGSFVWDAGRYIRDTCKKRAGPVTRQPAG